MAKVTTTIETITPEMASEYLKKNEVNRKLNKAQAQYYARMLSEGQWMLNGEAIVFDAKGNLSDGQHRLNAIIMSNVPMQTVVVRNVDCEAFATIDHGKARSHADSFKISGIANSVAVSAAIRRYIIMNRSNIGSLKTLGTTNSTVSTYKVSDMEMLSEYNSRPDFWQDEYSFAASCYGRCRLFASTDVMCISAYLQTTKGYNVEVVRDFFSQLFFEESTENGTLTLLRRIIINDAMKANGIRMTNKYKTQLLIKSWEAFKKDKTYKTLRWVKEIEGEYNFE